MTSLKAIDLRGNQLSAVMIKVLVETIRITPHAIFLDLRDIRESDPYIIKVLEDNLVENIRAYCRNVGLIIPEVIRAEALSQYLGNDRLEYDNAVGGCVFPSSPENDSRKYNNFGGNESLVIKNRVGIVREIEQLKQKLESLESKSNKTVTDNHKLDKLLDVLSATLSSLGSIFEDLKAGSIDAE